VRTFYTRARVISSPAHTGRPFETHRNDLSPCQVWPTNNETFHSEKDLSRTTIFHNLTCLSFRTASEIVVLSISILTASTGSARVPVLFFSVFSKYNPASRGTTRSGVEEAARSLHVVAICGLLTVDCYRSVLSRCCAPGRSSKNAINHGPLDYGRRTTDFRVDTAVRRARRWFVRRDFDVRRERGPRVNRRTQTD